MTLPPPTVSVMVPVRNEERCLARTLDQILRQDQTGIELEVFVVDGMSTDRTAEIAQDYARRFPQVRYLQNPKRLSSAARNLAIRNSHSDYVVLIDGHCEIPSRNYFHAMIQAFEKHGADCLGRPQPLDVTGASPLQLAIASARSSRLGHHPESHIYASEGGFVPAKSVAVAYRRSVFDKVGLFDETMDAHEDGEFNYRCDQAGLRCYLAPEITVRYFPRDSLLGLFKQMVRYGRGRVRFSRKHPGTWGLGTLVPALFVIYVVLGSFVALLVPDVRLGFILGLAVYAACVLGASAGVAWRMQQVDLLFRLPLVFATIHVGAGVGTLLEFVGG